jgi:hypothetical protein
LERDKSKIGERERKRLKLERDRSEIGEREKEIKIGERQE